MWGGLLTFIAAMFHLAILFFGPDWTYIAGIPSTLLEVIPVPETILLILISLLLLAISAFAFRCVRRWETARKSHLIIWLVALVFLIWGITGAPLNHLKDWSPGYSLFHVIGAFYITLTGACFALAGWSLRRG